MNERKPIICLDFDGVIHSYEHGWKDGSIYGTVTPGFFEWAEEAAPCFKLVVYSSRSKTEDGRLAMQEWMRDQWRRWLDRLPGDRTPLVAPASFEFAHEKPTAFMTIDDRAICFDGKWSGHHLTPEALLAFKPWTQH